jgi:hypothetical protein
MFGSLFRIRIHFFVCVRIWIWGSVILKYGSGYRMLTNSGSDRIRSFMDISVMIHRIRIYKTGLDIFYLLNCELEAEMSCS